jgi:hypothetical protein
MLIGEIDFNDINIIESNVGDISLGKKVGLCKIEVRNGGNEGPIPYFHIYNDNFLCCLCIYEARYFDHGIHQDTLNNNQLKKLDSWFREPYRKGSIITRWEFGEACWKFKSDEEEMRFRITVRQPNYKDTKGYKSK